MLPPINIRIQQQGVVVGPSMKALNQRMSKEVGQNPEWQTVLAGIRGALTTIARAVDPNATGDLQLSLVSDGSQVQVQVNLTITGI